MIGRPHLRGRCAKGALPFAMLVCVLAVSACGGGDTKQSGVRRLPGDMALERTVEVKGLDPCFDKVVIQIVQSGDTGEAHAADAAGGVAKATFKTPFISIKPLRIVVWPTRLKATPECAEKQLNVPYVKELEELPSPADVTVADADRKRIKVPGGPELPGQDGRAPSPPERADKPPPEGKVSDPGGLGLRPRPNEKIAADKSEQENLTGGTVTAKGGAAADFVYRWKELARGVYWADVVAPPGVATHAHGPAIAFLVEPDYDCKQAVFYQWVRQTLTFSAPGAKPFVGHVGPDGTSAVDSDAPQVDKQLPYPSQHTKANPHGEGTSPFAEDAPGFDKSKSVSDIANFFEALFPGAAVPAGFDRLVIDYEFWTYVICIDPYYVVGRFEWKYDLTLDLGVTPATVKPDRVRPSVTWVAGA